MWIGPSRVLSRNTANASLEGSIWPVIMVVSVVDIWRDTAVRRTNVDRHRRRAQSELSRRGRPSEAAEGVDQLLAIVDTYVKFDIGVNNNTMRLAMVGVRQFDEAEVLEKALAV